MITVHHLYKSFGKLSVLNNISLTCRQGEAISLIGPNASGKTTFIKCLLGMVIPDKGVITVNEETIAGKCEYRNRIGYMPQIGRYPDNMTIGQIFDMIIDLRKSSHKETDTELMESFALKNIFNKRMRTLSGGTIQKVSASLAFLFTPDVLILDEPTAGLDPLACEILKEKIQKEKTRGKLILITSHILSDLDDLVSEIIYFNEGKLLFHKSLKQLRTDTGEEKLTRAIASVMEKNKAVC